MNISSEFPEKDSPAFSIFAHKRICDVILDVGLEIFHNDSRYFAIISN